MAQVSQAEMKSRVDEILNRWPAVGLAFGVVRNGSLEFFSAHGLADIETGTPIADDTVFRIGSITKTFTAIAAMKLVERGLVDLDAPADEYLRAYRLVPAEPGWRPATVRHLLTHTAGIGEQVPRSSALRRDFGVTVPMDRPVPTLAEHYRGHVRLDTEPGTRFRYTDHGPATVGQIVEDVTEMPLDRYLREHVFLPLGMTSTDLLRSEIVRPRVATGYVLRAHGPKAVTERQFLTAAAGSAYSTPRTWPATCRRSSAGAAMSTARSSSRRRWPPCRGPVPTRSAAGRCGPGVPPRRRRRPPDGRAPGNPPGVQVADLPRPRRRSRGDGVQQRHHPRRDLAAGRDEPAARAS